MNPLELLKVFKDPKQIVLKLVGANTSPIMKNILDMANNNDTDGLEKFARNIFKEQGRDFDKEFNDFKNTFKF